MARGWTEEELLIAMNLYCKLPFGQLNHRNPLIVEVAKKLDRTPSSLSMKLCNFASFDPELQARGVKGLRGASRADREVWGAFMSDWQSMSDKSESAYEDLMQGPTMGPIVEPDDDIPTGPSEVPTTAKARRHQRFFRNAVLSSYDFKCALSGLNVRTLLVASHIIPWSECEARRADPTNGICLNSLYDRAFDRKLIGFDDDYRLIVSKPLKRAANKNDFVRIHFLEIEGKKLARPDRFVPDLKAIGAHRAQLKVG